MSKHRSTRAERRRQDRRRARRRLGVMVGAVVVSAGIGVSAFAVAPKLGAQETPRTAPAALETQRLEAVPTPVAKQVEAVAASANVALPKDSGTGRRIVFDQSDQRVWLVEAEGTVARTYLVSGSRFENLKPGSYQVQSRQRHATAFDYSGTMEYFVRFATGFSEPIGFHTVPKDNSGRLEQTKEQLGTRLSAGCVRQWPDDAIALWDFAPVGTPVVVTA